MVLLAIGVVDEIPTPDIVLALGPWLNSAARTECSPALSARESEALLLPPA